MAQSCSESSPSANALRIGGLVPFTATDYPDLLSAVIFCQGCPWRCAYCHNPHLIPAHGESSLPWPDIHQWLATRQELLDGVVFSGGEPTAQAALLAAVQQVKQLDFKIGLHTGGAYPRRLQKLLPYLDWIGLDIKATRQHYPAITYTAESGNPAFESLTLVQEANIHFEIRTTVHNALTPEKELLRLAQELKDAGVQKWTLQSFRGNGCDNNDLILSMGNSILNEPLLSRLRSLIGDIVVR